MIDDLERRLREQLGSAELPSAPATIHAALDRLAVDAVPAEPTPVRGRVGLGPLSLVVALVAVVAIGGGLLLGGRFGGPGTSSAPDGWAAFRDDRLSFEYPTAWQLRDARAGFSGGSTIAVLGTVDVPAACGGGHVDINCYYQEPLGPGQVSVVLGTQGFRGGSIFDPGAANAVNEDLVIAGLPARRSAVEVGPEDFYRSDFSITWLVAFPESATNAWTIEARGRGPGTELQLAALDRLISTVRVDGVVPEAAAAVDRLDLVRRTLEQLAADWRKGHGDPDDPTSFYDCFPREIGRRAATLSVAPGGRLGGELEVTCSTAMRPTRAWFHEIELSVEWEAAEGRPPGRYVERVWVATDGTMAGNAWSGDEFPAPDWGPLAVDRTDAGMDALIHGTLVMTDECVFLDERGERVLLVWPSDRTAWDPVARTITFGRPGGGVRTIGEGDTVALGGGGSSTAEGGPAAEEWLQTVDWVAPPAPACVTDTRWFVSDVQ